MLQLLRRVNLDLQKSLSSARDSLGAYEERFGAVAADVCHLCGVAEASCHAWVVRFLDELWPQVEDALDSDRFDELLDLLSFTDEVERSNLESRLRQELFRVWIRHPDLPNEPPGNTRLTKAEKDIIQVIRDAGHRLKTMEVLAAFEMKRGPVSEGTTKVCLAVLVRRELLTNRQDVEPKGYGLPEWDV